MQKARFTAELRTDPVPPEAGAESGRIISAPEHLPFMRLRCYHEDEKICRQQRPFGKTSAYGQDHG